MQRSAGSAGFSLSSCESRIVVSTKYASTDEHRSYPEVSGLTLEEIGEVFKHGFGVRYASRLRRDRKDEIRERMRTMEKPLAIGH
jgi:hypothetical protein